MDLSHLQQRSKWFLEKKSLKAGCMVILTDENLPPGNGLWAEFLKVIPGSDGKVRVLEIKTLSEIVTGSLSKICLLDRICLEDSVARWATFFLKSYS